MNDPQTPSTFLSADWGTTHFRLRLLTDAGTHTLASFAATQGAAALATTAGENPLARAEAFAACLRAAVDALRPQAHQSLDALPIAISGMATSAFGWCEAPYQPLPFTLDGRSFACVEHNLAMPGRAAHPLYFLSGVHHTADVMRGEETQLVGLIQYLRDSTPPNDFLALLPGTHCKHALIQADKLVDFQTYMTGELYALLAHHSVLRHTVSQGLSTVDSAAHGAGFDAALRDTGILPVGRLADVPRPGLAEALFQVRARGVLNAATPPELAGYLSGLLIGSELNGRLIQAHPSLPILLCADAALEPLYTRALHAAGLRDRLRIVPPEIVTTLAGRGQATFLEQHGIDQSHVHPLPNA